MLIKFMEISANQGGSQDTSYPAARSFDLVRMVYSATMLDPPLDLSPANDYIQPMKDV